MPVSSAKKTHLLYMEIICLKDVTDSGKIQTVKMWIQGYLLTTHYFQQNQGKPHGCIHH